MMLSRVAERLYWMARYLERAEDTARLINAYTHLMLDVPRDVEPRWHSLIDTFDAGESFGKRYRKMSERNVMKYLLVDTNISSIPHSIRAARENVRTTRDVLPAQAWELVNEIQMMIADAGDSVLARTPRFEFLERVIAGNQQLNGLIQTSVTRDHAYWFIKLGQFIERADMTSRIMRVTKQTIDLQRRDDMPDYPLLWGYLLKSLSATAAYRRNAGPGLAPNDIVEFIVRQQHFPRSIAFCLNRIEETVGALKAPAGLLHGVRAGVTRVGRFKAAVETPESLYPLIEDVQVRLSNIDEEMHETWFTADSQ